jgi:hypothetical protein
MNDLNQTLSHPQKGGGGNWWGFDSSHPVVNQGERTFLSKFTQECSFVYTDSFLLIHSKVNTGTIFLI